MVGQRGSLAQAESASRSGPWRETLRRRDRAEELNWRAVMPGKRVQFDDETWHALNLLARDRMQDFQELADEAFRDLLQKHGRPTDLKTALRQSAGVDAVVEKLSTKSKARPKR
jgi:hypothetical protein